MPSCWQNNLPFITQEQDNAFCHSTKLIVYHSPMCHFIFTGRISHSTLQNCHPTHASRWPATSIVRCVQLFKWPLVTEPSQECTPTNLPQTNIKKYGHHPKSAVPLTDHPRSSSKKHFLRLTFTLSPDAPTQNEQLVWYLLGGLLSLLPGYCRRPGVTLVPPVSLAIWESQRITTANLRILNQDTVSELHPFSNAHA